MIEIDPDTRAKIERRLQDLDNLDSPSRRRHELAHEEIDKLLYPMIRTIRETEKPRYLGLQIIA